MSRRLPPLLGLAAMLALSCLWFIAVPLVSAGNPCFHDFKMPAASTGSGTEIRLEACAFAPTVTSVAAGSTVTFRNGPTFTHLITGANQAWGSREVEVQPNATVAYRFDEAGTYPYACALHPGMSGVIVVGDGASTGTATTGTTTTIAAAAPPTVEPPTTAPSLEGPGLVALSAAAGAIVGGVVVGWSMRRRAVRRDEPVAGIA